MALSGPTLGTAIDTLMIGLGAVGSNRTKMSDAIGIGCVNHIVAAANWTTTIVGTTAGNGGAITGSGIFETIPGVPFLPATLGAEIFAKWLLLSGAPGGINGLSTAVAIATAISAHIATLAAYAAVPSVIIICAGSGIVLPGSFSGMVGDTMGAAIKTELISRGANPNASSIADFCNGIGRAVVDAIQTRGTGTVITVPLSGPPCVGSAGVLVGPTGTSIV
jgi:hypothetical protein